ncbi:hypothetical protein D8M04_02845 [Oceanobacillus piezotolerans]|uniref:Cell wall elongation regulator TseB-like domain-containing protein n=1 Tax=Oceanobacillus piezotolerans TaxID=2448030 RepID=A0A498DMF6_9BACI|nr:DUF5590 domain-containing protein [Oceanobacillus piezotolerans]RLL48230.1 hypothetical protein D8M04_02845 [Oceanobacillus piezotolerans]
MKKKLFSLSTGPSWLKIVSLSISVLLIIAIVYGIYLYNTIYDSKTVGFNETVNTIIEQTSISDVTSVERFHGDEAYHVVLGETEKGEEQIIFYPLEGKEKNITSVPTSEILPKDAILQDWYNSCDSCKFVRITPAILEDDVLWEIAYYTEDGRYGLDYISMYDGTLHEQYFFRKMFN